MKLLKHFASASSMINLTTNVVSGSYPSIRNRSSGIIKDLSEASVKNYFDSYELLLKLYNMPITELILSRVSSLLKEGYKNPLDLVSFKDSNRDSKALKSVNNILASFNLGKRILESLDDIVYWDSVNFAISYDRATKKFSIKDLQVPFLSVRCEPQNEPYYWLVRNAQGSIFKIPGDSIIHIGGTSLTLTDTTENSDDYLAEEHFRASRPMYFRFLYKLKEYWLYEQLLSLLSIKELLQPLLLLLNFDKNTDRSSATSYAEKVEDLINKYSDLTTIISSNNNIQELLDAVVNNVRVVPDFGGNINNLGQVDLSKLKERLDAIKAEQDGREDQILNSLGLSRDFIQGKLNKWEALKLSDPLNSRVLGIINNINESVCEIAARIHNLVSRVKIKPSDLSCNLFGVMPFLSAAKADAMEVLRTNAETLSSIINTIGEVVDNDRVEGTAALAYLNKKLQAADPEATFLKNDI